MPIQALEELDIRGKLDVEQLSKNFLRDRDSAKSYFDAAVQQKWQDAIKHWQGKHLKEPLKGRSRIFIRKPRTIAQRIQAGLLDAFFSNPDELVSVLPGRKMPQPVIDPRTGQPIVDPNTQQPVMQPPQDVTAARIRQAYLNYRLTNTIPWFRIVHSAIDDVVVFNLCVAEVSWVKRIERYEIQDEQPTLNPMTGQPMTGPDGQSMMQQLPPRTEELVLQNEPRIRLIVPERIKVDSRVDWINPFDGQFFIHEDYMTLQELLQLAEGDPLIDMDNITASPAVARSNDSEGVIDQQRRNLSGQQFDDPDRKEIHCNFYFYKVAGKWWVAWMDNEGRTLRQPDMVREAHGKPGYVIGVLEPESHVFYGDSKLTQLKDYFVLKNGWRNLRLDNVVRIMNRHTIYNKDQEVDIASLTNKRAGGTTGVTGDVRTAVAQEDMPDLGPSSYNEESMLDRDIEEGSVTDISQGLTLRTKELATQTVAREQNASIKEAVNIRIFAETFIQPCAEMLLALAEQYEDDKSMMQIVGEMAGFAFPDDNIPSLIDIKGRYHVRVKAGLGTANRQTKTQNMDVALQRVTQIYGPVAGIPMLRDYLNQLGVGNVDEVIEYVKQGLLMQMRTATEERQAKREPKGGKPVVGGNGKGRGNGGSRMTNDTEELRKVAR